MVSCEVLTRPITKHRAPALSLSLPFAPQDQVDQVIMFGGAQRMPAVQASLLKVTGGYVM
jgi:molecular chaperone DnaK (HSP70)